MLKPINELFRRVKPGPSLCWGDDLTSGLSLSSERLKQIADDRMFRHFARIPSRIARCLDYFNVRCDRLAVEHVLAAYYLFIGVVDNALDSGDAGASKTVFERLETTAMLSSVGDSDVALVTENLKFHIGTNTLRREVIVQMHELYRSVIAERSSVSLNSYIHTRLDVGRLTAEISYRLIRPHLNKDEFSFRRFMQEVGAIGCLVDSVIDLDADRRSGLLGFQPTLIDRVRLILHTALAGWSILFKHPALLILFLRAILDNVGDRFIRRRSTRTRLTDDFNGETAHAA